MRCAIKESSLSLHLKFIADEILDSYGSSLQLRITRKLIPQHNHSSQHNTHIACPRIQFCVMWFKGKAAASVSTRRCPKRQLTHRPTLSKHSHIQRTHT